MPHLLYIIAIVLIIAWAIGYFGFHGNVYIHILLGLAVFAVLVRNIKGRPFKRY